MAEEGVLDGRVLGNKADFMFGLHNWPSAPKGQILWRTGPMMAATNTYTIRIIGKGGHAAAPQQSRDPIVAAAQIVTALQSIAARRVDPLDSIVISVTSFQAGTTFNVIPQSAVLKGTMRTLRPETRVLGEQEIRAIANGVAEAMGCQAEIDWVEGYPVVDNDPVATELVKRVASDVVGPDRVQELTSAVMGGEDFSYYGAYAPSSFFFVGAGREGGSPGVHRPDYDFNDEILSDAIEIMCGLALTGASE